VEISVVAYFAELDQNNIVQRVISVDNNMLLDSSGIESELVGVAYCTSLFGESTVWIQTSYNTSEGEHGFGKTPLRKNYAGIGMIYDPVRDAFYAPKPPGDYWLFDEYKCIWYDPENTQLNLEVTRI
jgi:hypothetical protein